MTAEPPSRDAGVDPVHGSDVDSIVDAHVHVWDAALAEYPWLVDTPQLDDRYDLDDVADEHAAVGVRHVVLVQAADNVEDTEHMLAVAARDPRVAGVVGWLPLLHPDAATACLERWAGRRLVGARHLIHRDPDPDLLSRRAVDDVLAELADRALTFDVCAESTHLLGLVPALAERHPQLTLVIDHLAKPPIEEHGWEPWAGLLRRAAAAPNVVAKLSGLNTAAGVGATTDDYQPYVDHALEVFGPDRLMFGGDWPFALLAARSYRDIVEPMLGCLTALDADERRAVLSGTARRVYGLSVP
jgi:L-fuconolactonase